MMSFRPDLLIVSSWAPPSVGGPENLYNIFSQLRSHTFCIYTFFKDLKLNCTSKSYGSWLRCPYYFPDHNPIHAENKNFGKKVTTHFSEIHSSKITRTWKKLKEFLRRFHWIEETYFSGLWVYNVFRYYLGAKKIIQKIQPLRILAISDTGYSMFSSYILARFTKIPLYVYLFDLYDGGGFESSLQKWISKFIEPRLIRLAKSIIVTNEATQKLYQGRYPDCKTRFLVVHNSIFRSNYPQKIKPFAPRPPYSIVFTGRIYWAQEKSLLNLIDTMKELIHEPIFLKLYAPVVSPKICKSIQNQTNVELLSAPQFEMPSIHTQADILFLPLSFHTTAPQIISTATPGKLSNYLISGRPILIHAPSYAYISQQAKAKGYAEVVDTENSSDLKTSIWRLLKDVDYSLKLIQQAQREFGESYDAVKNKDLVFQALDLK